MPCPARFLACEKITPYPDRNALRMANAVAARTVGRRLMAPSITSIVAPVDDRRIFRRIGENNHPRRLLCDFPPCLSCYARLLQGPEYGCRPSGIVLDLAHQARGVLLRPHRPDRTSAPRSLSRKSARFAILAPATDRCSPRSPILGSPCSPRIP